MQQQQQQQHVGRPQQQKHIKRHPPAQPFNNTDVRTMEKGEGHGIGNSLDSGHGVGNDLDRGRVDILVDGVDMRP